MKIIQNSKRVHIFNSKRKQNKNKKVKNLEKKEKL
jgi:hypothetical protein